MTGFYQDKKIRYKDGVFECYPSLKEITIKSKKLEHVYEGAFVGLDKNTVIKVPESCLKKYKKLFRKAGLDKKVKVKAISGKKKFSPIISKDCPATKAPVRISEWRYQYGMWKVADNADNKKVETI